VSSAAVAVGGLAPLSTSGTGSRDSLEVVSNHARWKKLRKAIRESARLHASELEAGRERSHCVMVTLTYSGDGRRGDEAGQCQPRHVSDYLRLVRQWAGRRGFSLRYVWVGELQARGALHYHVVYWLPKRISMPKADKQGWWKHGRTNVIAARSAVGYLTKYISKLRSKGAESQPFPKGFRMHGCGGLTGDGREVRAWTLLPRWVQDLGDWSLRFRRAVGGGLFSKLTGEWFQSPWVVLYVERRPGVGAVIHIGRRTEAGF